MGLLYLLPLWLRREIEDAAMVTPRQLFSCLRGLVEMKLNLNLTSRLVTKEIVPRITFEP
jgi:hypothetical protein